ncbi:hypothetical protein IAD21_04915 [Abditibacteriota bacterium]|nr:hypothetical protein IAD21_04915 [Abditibacteriota bacterium]
MNELRIHIERIVRPIGATQGRKLRMRLELWGHLQSIWEEERHHSPDNEEAAIERAKRRLGDPTELTRELQQTVPAFERTLLNRIPLSSRMEAFERQMARVPGQRGPMTLGHKIILSALATLLTTPLFLSMHSGLLTAEMQPAHAIAALVGTTIGCWTLLFASYHFVFTAASHVPHEGGSGTLKRAATILALHLALAFFIAFTISNRSATPIELLTCAVSTLTLLIASQLITARIGVLRRSYDDWLTLNIDG